MVMILNGMILASTLPAIERREMPRLATFCLVNLLLVYKDNVGIFPLLGKTLSGPTLKDKIMQPPM